MVPEKFKKPSLVLEEKNSAKRLSRLRSKHSPHLVVSMGSEASALRSEMHLALFPQCLLSFERLLCSRDLARLLLG